MQIKVQGGTGAGSRTVKVHRGWECACPKVQPGDRYSCGDCGQRRPTGTAS